MMPTTRTIAVLAAPPVARSLAAKLGDQLDTVIEVYSPRGISEVVAMLRAVRADMILHMASANTRELRDWIDAEKLPPKAVRIVVISVAELRGSIAFALEAVLLAAAA